MYIVYVCVQKALRISHVIAIKNLLIVSLEEGRQELPEDNALSLIPPPVQKPLHSVWHSRWSNLSCFVSFGQVKLPKGAFRWSYKDWIN